MEAETTLMTGHTQDRERRTAWIARLLDWIDDHVADPIELDPRQPGWTAHRVPGSRTIEYRDPVWDRRHACDACSGSGLEGVRTCRPCEGCGVITLEPAEQDGSIR
jgi:hypothetical protein